MLVLIGLFAPAAAFAQTSVPIRTRIAEHMQMMMTGKDHSPAQKQSSGPTEVGEGAFAAIQEIVALLNADPKTDWSKVDIDALRQHLVDMNNVTLKASVTSAPIDAGVRFEVTGEGSVRDLIRRMVLAHAATMNGGRRLDVRGEGDRRRRVARRACAAQGRRQGQGSRLLRHPDAGHAPPGPSPDDRARDEADPVSDGHARASRG